MWEGDAHEAKRISAYRDAGSVFGRELGKALCLAVGTTRGDRAVKLKLSAITMSSLLAAVQRLRDAGAPIELVQTYERAAGDACWDEFARGLYPAPSRIAA